MQSAARRRCAVRVNRRVAFLDVDDLARPIDHEGGAIGDADLLVEDPVRFGDLPLAEIAGQGEGKLQFFLGPVAQGGQVVSADADDARAGGFKSGDTSLVRREFLRSTTGESGRKERQHDCRLAAKVGELDIASGCGRQIEVGRHIADFEICVGRLHSLTG